MQFRFDDDQLAMRDAVRAFCTSHFDLASIATRERRPAEPSAWAGLAELGVLGMLTDDSGVGAVEAAIVFEELGAHLASGPVLWTVLAAPYVAGAAEGAVRVTGFDPDAGSELAVVLDHADESDAVAVRLGDRLELVLAAELPEALEGSPLDPLTPVGVFASMPGGTVVATGDQVQRLCRLGETLSAATLVGVAQGALDVARSYALEREQFGVPIGSFQAVKHLLADMYVRVELARASTYAAAAIVADPRAGDPVRAAGAAKLLAADAALANSRTAVQVLGGMGFTWEMLPHYFLKRAWVLEHQFGTAATHASTIGDAIGAEVAAA